MEQLPHYLMNKLIEFYSESENTKKVPWTWVFHPSDIKLVEESNLNKFLKLYDTPFISYSSER